MNHLETPLGHSPVFLSLMEQISQAAGTERPVLVIGERGTGKEMVANRLHYLSSRWEGPLVSLNCAALSETLLEAELFGHEAGAYTGAQKTRIGRFERADQGSLFLDEIGTASLQAQEKLLRIVEYGVFERLGGQQERSVNVRLIGATNSDLPSQVASGKFRADLLDRLAFEVITLPPLRARLEDVPLLAQHFAHQMAIELAWEEKPKLSQSFLDTLALYHWPGNVRELRNVVARAVARTARDQIIETIPLDPFESPWRPKPSIPPVVSSLQSDTGRVAGVLPIQSDASVEEVKLPHAGALKQRLHEIEKYYVHHALEAAQYHQKQAASSLGLNYHQFRHLVQKHKL